MAEPEVTYCSDYEAITGLKIPVVEAKVIEAPVKPAVEKSPAKVTTKG